MGSLRMKEGIIEKLSTTLTITKDYYIRMARVTQAQWTSVMGTKPWEGKSNVKTGDNYPCNAVSWDDAKGVYQKLNELEKQINTDFWLQNGNMHAKEDQRARTDF